MMGGYIIIIKRNTPLEEALSKPGAEQVFQSYGIRCFG
ncbi:hypothetical protein SYNTR_0637 [Candidatus Syntrophocurvum alkaliphilum]|uniref:Uncharacterized protein n=1 Tax=Candidatus Syntrophocurvum alkaliphilum TaxID=2293317 RepID=A0A6I6DDW0_9FIRM|nr:hypothetical protein SYNTR_0637 [Candidatus Syntrophocurvum alkaliphilum]